MGGKEQSIDPDGDPLSDRRTLEAFRRRERSALGRVFDAAFPFVYAIAHRTLGDRDRAEDATQDVFAKVYRAADRLDPERPLKPWLTTITVNTCRDHLRRRARRIPVGRDPSDLERIGHDHGPPEYQVMKEEERVLLQGALDSLKEEHREIVVLHLYSGQSHEESARSLGITPTAVRKRYSRALAELRTLLRRDGER